MVKAPEVTIDKAKPARVIIFNVLDSDMNGSLSMEEFFIFLKHHVVFSAFAGAQDKPTAYSITKPIYNRNKDSVSELVSAFPSRWEDKCMASLEGFLIDNEINLKEFLLIFLAGRTFSHLATSEPGYVSLTDIMVNAKRWDLFATSPKTFIHYLSQGNVAPKNQTPMYNYGIAMQIMLKLEITAVKLVRADTHKES